MSELRFDPIRNRWTIIAPERKHRPDEFVVPDSEEIDTDATGCPFDSAVEPRHLHEIFAIPQSEPREDGPSWQVRVVASRFPVLRVEGQVEREGSGLYDRVTGVGAHEVIVESPDHHRETADLDIDELEQVLSACRSRFLDLRRDRRLRYTLLVKSRGRRAGASLSHPHWQLIALPIIPTHVVQELRASREHFRGKERCLFCDLIRQEQRLVERVALETDRYIAVTPFASAFPFETWILPKAHHHDFATITDDDLLGFAAILRDLLRRLRMLLDDPPYNVVVHTAPSPHPRPGQPDYWTTIEHDYHWHAEIIPRITRVSGIEWSSGLRINPTPPEEAARFLRAADPEREDDR
jgi:UDPglucose--hexose-1-phosphate uridylyltransferase